MATIAAAIAESNAKQTDSLVGYLELQAEIAESNSKQTDSLVALLIIRAAITESHLSQTEAIAAFQRPQPFLVSVSCAPTVEVATSIAATVLVSCSSTAT